MTDKLEEVARAICKVRGHNPNMRVEEYGQSSHQYWEWELFTKEAKAAIEAMREPTDEMKIAGIDVSPMGRVKYDDGGALGKWVSYDTDKTGEIWQAMIDKALAD